MAANVQKTLTDAGYIVIGLGVMTFQQAQARVHDIRVRAAQAGECVQHRTRDAQSKLQTQSVAARDRAGAQVRTTVEKAADLRTDLKTRVEPVVGHVQSQLGELPERVVQAMEPVAARVRGIAGSTAA
jgi:hypothetical protein